MSRKHHSHSGHREPDKQYSHSAQTRERKRSQFSKPAQQKISSTSVLVIVLTGLLAIAAYLVLSSANTRPASTSVTVANSVPAQKIGESAGTDIVIPISDAANGQARFFDYTATDTRPVRFFVIKSSDGVYRAAIDACDVCFAGKKGYHQEGDNMICNKCGREFPSALVNEVSGGCNPIGLPRAVEGDKLVIKASELENRKSYF